MKRGPLMVVVLTIELVIALVLIFNYQFILDRLSVSQNSLNLSPNNPPSAATSSPDELTMGTESNAPAVPNLAVPNVAVPNVAEHVESTAQSVPVMNPEGALIPELSPAILSLFAPLPAAAPPSSYQLTDELVLLGKTLFYDPRLSKNQQQSCHSCHILSSYGTDQLPVSIGHDGNQVKRNAPTVYNAALHIAQFWDGRSATVEEQAKAPILNAGEMGMLDPSEVIATLQSLRGYQPLFTAAFPDQADPITFENLATAIGAFERRLMTPARFDRFLLGDYTQLSVQEQRGLATFAELGCPTCHVGVTVGGLLYKKLGEVEPYPVEDLGRYLVTGLESDRHVFKVPSLRNAAATGPYLHDGSIATLEEMVVLMARHQLGKEVTPTQVDDIVAFIHSLTGEIPTAYIAPPPLP